MSTTTPSSVITTAETTDRTMMTPPPPPPNRSIGVTTTTSNPNLVHSTVGVFRPPTIWMWQPPPPPSHVVGSTTAPPPPGTLLSSSSWQQHQQQTVRMYPSLFPLPPPPPPPLLAPPPPLTQRQRRDDDDDHHHNNNDTSTVMSEDDELEDLVVWEDHSNRNPLSTFWLTSPWRKLLWCWRVQEEPPKLVTTTATTVTNNNNNNNTCSRSNLCQQDSSSRSRRRSSSPTKSPHHHHSPASSSSSSVVSTTSSSYHSIRTPTAMTTKAYNMYYAMPPPPPPPLPPGFYYHVHPNNGHNNNNNNCYSPTLAGMQFVSPSPPEHEHSNDDSLSNWSMYYDPVTLEDDTNDSDNFIVRDHVENHPHNRQPVLGQPQSQLQQQQQQRAGEEKKDDPTTSPSSTHDKATTLSSNPVTKPEPISLRTTSAPAAPIATLRPTSVSYQGGSSSSSSSGVQLSNGVTSLSPAATTPAAAATTTTANTFGNGTLLLPSGMVQPPPPPVVTTKSGRPPLVQRSKSLHPKPPVPPPITMVKPPLFVATPPSPSPQQPPLIIRNASTTYNNINNNYSSNHHHNGTMTSVATQSTNKGITYNRARTGTMESRTSTLTNSSRHRRTKEHYDFSSPVVVNSKTAAAAGATSSTSGTPSGGIPEMVHITVTFHPDDGYDDYDDASSLGDSFASLSLAPSPKQRQRHVSHQNASQINRSSSVPNHNNNGASSTLNIRGQSVGYTMPNSVVSWSNDVPPPRSLDIVPPNHNGLTTGFNSGYLSPYYDDDYSDDDDDSLSFQHLRRTMTDEDETARHAGKEEEDTGANWDNDTHKSPFAHLDRVLNTHETINTMTSNSAAGPSFGGGIPNDGWVLDWVNQKDQQNSIPSLLPDPTIPTKVTSEAATIASSVPSITGRRKDSMSTLDSSWRKSHTVSKYSDDNMLSSEYLPLCFELEQSFCQVVLSGWIAYSVNDAWELGKYREGLESVLPGDDHKGDRDLQPLPRWDAVDRRHLAYMIVCRGDDGFTSSPTGQMRPPTLTLIPACAASTNPFDESHRGKITTVTLTEAWQCTCQEISRQHGRCVVLSFGQTSYTLLPVSLPLYFFEPPADETEACCSSDSWRRLPVSDRKFAYLAPCMFPPFCHPPTLPAGQSTTENEKQIITAPTSRNDISAGCRQHAATTSRCDDWPQRPEEKVHVIECDDNDGDVIWNDYWESFAPDEQHDAALHILFTLDSLIKQNTPL